MVPRYNAENQLNFENIKAELGRYKERADASWAQPEADRPSLWAFWLGESLMLPCWWAGACKMALFTPSSCTVERAFSMLCQWLSNNQEGMLEDYMCASVMVRYNTLWRERDAKH